MSVTAKNTVLVLLVLALVIVPLVMNNAPEFRGADDQGKELIGQIDNNYQPWYSSLWEPPGAEMQSLLFALQAALGSGFIGYYFGYMKGKKKHQQELERDSKITS
ncbi:Cobalt transport protein CbiN [Desulfofarcimen acetoxidans DSM 771]|jgi:cobalt/nickel transport protein|uniref:Cobalt transport protein CbiN n=1 Tax=Desulfofarcimen acetoxidans (strain ATCC 49208 / DSM 771 / KCTC 5769 / VKM B-1644 / 5575) TaxID=485916 RepID=C8VWS9_DESAS|nr:energy-coupling factor ABC transporter substrate-binding protein [Desulfofarcimen acetoxidans]ACV64443.1 Cobalt transport protein CbiN [Desulfofarcimen acetoxidans DSM 771]